MGKKIKAYVSGLHFRLFLVIFLCGAFAVLLGWGIFAGTLQRSGRMVLSASVKQQVLLWILAFILFLIPLALGLSYLLLLPLNKTREAILRLSAGLPAQEETQKPTYTELNALTEAARAAIARMNTLDESRDEFVSNVSHELKTPLAAMKVLADSLLSQEEVSADIYREFLEDITKEIDRENHIINDLLSLVQLENKNALEVESVSVNALTEYVLKRLRPIAQQKNVELVLESYRPVVAEIDEAKMAQAFTNLLENAIKYNIDGGWVHVTLNADHKYFYLRVEDSGAGIPEEDADRVFERFYRVDKSHSREIGGTGLGLSITRDIVLRHQGDIRLYSREDEGTTFELRIPLFYAP